jgi:hypothetical protein
MIALFSLASVAVYAQGGSAEPAVTPKNGQNAQQLAFDRYECYGWAKKQSEFDPAQPNGQPSGLSQYRRAFTACMSGRGYDVVYQPETPPIPPAYAAPAPPVRVATPVAPQLVYRPVHFQVEGGYTVAAGKTGDSVDDGGNVGFGIGFFPSPSLPVGIRVDGSYSRFDARNSLLDSGDFDHGHEAIYGGDVDLQLNLAHVANNFQLYLLGGAGWYREHTYLSGFSTGLGCGYFKCRGGAQEWSTSPWRDSWNAGVGGEVALRGGASFFVEARYQRIAPRESDMQFIPIRVGLRF